MDNLEWEKIGEFIKSVGIPFCILLIFVGPVVFALYKLIRIYGARIFEAILKYLTTAEECNRSNTDSVAILAKTGIHSSENHDKTHDVLLRLCHIGRSVLRRSSDNELKIEILPHFDAIDRLLEK